jgi:hypothetical protein
MVVDTAWTNALLMVVVAALIHGPLRLQNVLSVERSTELQTQQRFQLTLDWRLKKYS